MEFIHAQRKANRIAVMCRLYGVTRAGYYAWRSRPLCDRHVRDRELLVRIRALHADHDGNYGSPRIHGALRRGGERIGVKRVARLMREGQLRGKVADLYRSRAGTKAFFARVPNRQLDVLANAPNRVWVGRTIWAPWRAHMLMDVVLDSLVA